MRKKIFIEGMSCGHCVAHVERALKELQEITDIKVDLAGKNAIVESNGEISDAKLREAIDEAGYDVVQIENI